MINAFVGGKVAGNRDAGASPRHLIGDGRHLLDFAGSDDHLTAGVEQALGDHAPDTATTACDNSSSALKPEQRSDAIDVHERSCEVGESA